MTATVKRFIIYMEKEIEEGFTEKEEETELEPQEYVLSFIKD
jgi:hypothetical protein